MSACVRIRMCAFVSITEVVAAWFWTTFQKIPKRAHKADWRQGTYTEG